MEIELKINASDENESDTPAMKNWRWKNMFNWLLEIAPYAHEYWTFLEILMIVIMWEKISRLEMKNKEKGSEEWV